MTLDEAIKHAEEVAEEKENEGKLLCQSESASVGCLACADEHRQLAEWLKDYKRLLEQPNIEMVAIEDVAKELGCQTIKTTMEWLNTLATLEKCGYAICKVKGI